VSEKTVKDNRQLVYYFNRMNLSPHSDLSGVSAQTFNLTNTALEKLNYKAERTLLRVLEI